MNLNDYWLDGEGNIDWDASAYEVQEYNCRWREIEYFVNVEPAAELHTMDVLMGRAKPPIMSFDPEYDDPFGAGWIISPEYWGIG